MASSNQQSLTLRGRLPRPPLDITYILVHQYDEREAHRNLRSLEKAQKEAPTETPEEASEVDSEEDPKEYPEVAPEEPLKKDPKKPKEVLEKRPESGSDSYDHVRIAYNGNSYLNALFPPDTDLPICRVHFSWTNFSGDMIGAYERMEDTLISHILLRETLRRYAGANGEISEVKITLIKERSRNGTLVVNGGRYIRLDVQFAGNPVRNAKIWGKRVTNQYNLGAVQLSAEERLRLKIEGNGWRWKPD